MSMQLSTRWQLKHLAWALVQLGLSITVWLAVSTAQVTTSIIPDGTLGTEVMQNGNGHIHEITGGTRPANGSNLFHSFDRFNVGTGDTAHFMATPDVVNIISRVTGGDESMIDGRVQADATLFLLNPSGIMFGPSARLDIAGSFHASTADVLRFEDGSAFAVDLSGPSSLSVAAPSTFGFVNANPADIAIRGSRLAVPEGETLAIVGGDIDMVGGSLQVLSGRIVIRGGQLTMAQSSIRVTNRSDQDGGGVDVEADSAITLIDTEILSDTLGTGKGGNIVLQAEILTLDDHTFIRSDTFGAGQGGAIELAVETLTLTGDTEIRSNSRSRAAGDAGAIIIHGRGGDGTAAHLVTLHESTLQTNTEGQGAGGTITVTADTVALAKTNLTATTTGAGQAGTLTLNAQTIELHNTDLTAATTGRGDAGDITLNVDRLHATEQSLIASDSTPSATGNAGNVTIQGPSGTGAATTVTLTDSMLRTETARGAGGTITVTADTVDLSNTNLTAATTGTGNAGNILLHVGHLSATRLTTLTTSSRGGGTSGSVTIQGLQGDGSLAQTVRLDNASIRNETFSPDQGGDIVVQAKTLSLTNTAALRSNTFGAGSGGQIALQAETLTLDEKASIQSDTFGAGQGGAIELAVETLTLTGDTEIRSNSRSRAAGDAGAIIIHGRGGDGTAAHLVTLHESTLQTNTEGQGAGGTITVTADTVALTKANLTATTTGAGQAGTLTLNAQTIELHNTDLTAATTGRGDAGDITLNVDRLHATEQSLIASDSTPSATGNAGNVTIQGPSGTGAATTVTLTDSMLRTETARGAGGTITVTADTVDLSNTNLTAATTGTGNAGNILLHVGHLSATRLTTLTTSSRGGGTSGSVTIQGLQGDGSLAQTVRLDNASIRNETFSPDQGGDIVVQAKTLSLTNTAALRSNTFGAGSGGQIALQAETLTLDEKASIQSDTFGAGQGGAIELAVETLTLTGGAEIRSNSLRTATEAAGDIIIHGRGGDGTAAHLVMLHESTLQTNTEGQGAGGTITVTADAVALVKANLTAATAGAGQAGAITLNVDRLKASEQTTITSSSTATATGNAGSVTMQGLAGDGTAARIVEISDSSVETRAASDQANGGTIRVQSQLIRLRDKSAIRSDTALGQRGGDITLDADFVVLEASDIIANSEAAQEKADINITGALITNPLSVVQASGGISIFGSVFDSSGAVQLPLDFLQRTALLSQRCAPGLRGSQASSFALVGRDGLPLEPGHMLLSNLPIGEHLQVQERHPPQTQIGDAEGFLPVAWQFNCDKSQPARDWQNAPDRRQLRAR